MDFKVFYDQDSDLSLIQNKKVAIIGYGSQGHAHALNLKESGVQVAVGLREGSSSQKQAEAEGLNVLSVSKAALWADIVMMLVPDEVMASVYQKEVEPFLSPGNALAFAHGFNVHFKKILPPEGVSVFMIAPKSPGRLVRRTYQQGAGVPCLIATLRENDSVNFQLALSYAKALGGTRAGVFQTNFKEETETDLFGEQTVLCGGLSALIKAGFETLVENGYSPVMAYFECLHEMKLIVDLVYEGGFSNMHAAISNTAEYGDYVTGNKIVGPETKRAMQDVLDNIRSGRFAEQWLEESRNGSRQLNSFREEERKHPIEEVGKALRQKMIFSKK